MPAPSIVPTPTPPLVEDRPKANGRGERGLIKRSVTIAGHRTSISLEPVFWDALVEAATADGQSLNGLVTAIDEARTTNLSSAIRVWLFERQKAACG